MIIYYFNHVCPNGDRCLGARYAEVLVAMAKGRVYAIGPPEEVLTERMVPPGRHGTCKRERSLSCEGVTQA
ncbi:hypothetical protein NPJ88_002195 [Halomonas elongata]|uniref:hypothetical protein n=1 Tax=Halomonas elongata TaxID=2746 RepID=UPI00255B288B|nr:hypothetical protein [Halomonas elongata]MDL4861132.1 hypothetical protein [Halomonas elongata]